MRQSREKNGREQREACRLAFMPPLQATVMPAHPAVGRLADGRIRSVQRAAYQDRPAGRKVVKLQACNLILADRAGLIAWKNLFPGTGR